MNHPEVATAALLAGAKAAGNCGAAATGVPASVPWLVHFTKASVMRTTAQDCCKLLRCKAPGVIVRKP